VWEEGRKRAYAKGDGPLRSNSKKYLADKVEKTKHHHRVPYSREVGGRNNRDKAKVKIPWKKANSLRIDTIPVLRNSEQGEIGGDQKRRKKIVARKYGLIVIEGKKGTVSMLREQRSAEKGGRYLSRKG